MVSDKVRYCLNTASQKQDRIVKYYYFNFTIPSLILQPMSNDLYTSRNTSRVETFELKHILKDWETLLNV